MVPITTVIIIQVLVDMIRVPDWAFEAAGQEMRGMGQDAAAFQPGLYLTPAQARTYVNRHKDITTSWCLRVILLIKNDLEKVMLEI